MNPARLIRGEALAELRQLGTASVDALVTDPPAGISFMGQAWDRDRGGRRQWVAWLTEVLGEGLRVLKPGASALVWGLPRTSHWTATAMEDAGLQVRDVITHVQGQGFPKSRCLLKPAAEHWILARAPGPLRHLNIDACRVGAEGTRRRNQAPRFTGRAYANGEVYHPEPWTSGSAAGRWPANFILSHGPECQPMGTQRVKAITGGTRRDTAHSGFKMTTGTRHGDPDGTEEVAAWRCAPGCPVAELDQQSGVRKAGMAVMRNRDGGVHNKVYGAMRKPPGPDVTYGDTGTASRFFYVAKASRRERGADNSHPTVKPLALMRWLCRLITPPGGLVLDPFAGSGTTGVAALQEGLQFLGIEREAEYCQIAQRRLAHALTRCAA
jgi:hypothetical protein